MSKKRKSSRAGDFGLTVEEAGGMIGLSHGAAYRAAKKGQIPTIRAGRFLVVPKAIWLRQLGVEPDARRPDAKRRKAAENSATA